MPCAEFSTYTGALRIGLRVDVPLDRRKLGSLLVRFAVPFALAIAFASWLNLSPKRDISGGKVIRHRREKTSNRVAAVLRMGASTLLRSDSYLGARYRNLRARLGAPKAVKAMARYLACLIYRLLTQGQEWIDRGAERFELQRQQRELSALQRRANSLGFQLVAQTTA